jgi:hypothetical protein
VSAQPQPGNGGLRYSNVSPVQQQQQVRRRSPHQHLPINRSPQHPPAVFLPPGPGRDAGQSAYIGTAHRQQPDRRYQPYPNGNGGGGLALSGRGTAAAAADPSGESRWSAYLPRWRGSSSAAPEGLPLVGRMRGGGGSDQPAYGRQSEPPRLMERSDNITNSSHASDSKGGELAFCLRNIVLSLTVCTDTWYRTQPSVAVFWICKYFLRIRIRGSLILDYGSGSRRPINYRSGRFRAIEKKFVVDWVMVH